MTIGRRRARAGRAADRRRSAGQRLPRLADRRRRGRRCRLRPGRPRRLAAARQSSHRHEPDGAARRRSGSSIRRAAATRCTSPARTSTSTATTSPARSASSPRTCASSRPMSAAASAPRTSPMPSTRWSCGRRRRVGRPVKWIASRSEVFLSDHAARDTQAEASLALDADGQVPGAAGRQRRQSRRLHDRRRRRRADLSSTSICRARCIASPRSRCTSLAVLTNTAPIGVTRGPGFAETVNILERLIDAAARQGGLRPRRAAPPQHGAGRRHADDQRLRLPGRQRHLRRDARRTPWPAPISPGFADAATAERGDRAGCAAWALPITSRAPAARRRRMSISASRPTARCR